MFATEPALFYWSSMLPSYVWIVLRNLFFQAQYQFSIIIIIMFGCIPANQWERKTETLYFLSWQFHVHHGFVLLICISLLSTMRWPNFQQKSILQYEAAGGKSPWFWICFYNSNFLQFLFKCFTGSGVDTWVVFWTEQGMIFWRLRNSCWPAEAGGRWNWLGNLLSRSWQGLAGTGRLPLRIRALLVKSRQASHHRVK